MPRINELLRKPQVYVCLALFCQALWGIVFPVIKKCYELFSISDVGSTYAFAGTRFVIAGLILLAIEAVKDRRLPLPDKKTILPLLFLGTVQTGIVYALQFAAMISASSINCSILNGTMVITSNIIAHFMFRDDRMTARKAIGSVIGFSGVLVCFLYGGALEGFTPGGEGLMFLSITAFAFGSNLSRKIASGISPIVASGYNLLIGGLEILILSFILGGSLSGGGVLGYALLLFLAMVSSLCLLLWTSLININSVGKISVFQCINPITGAIAASLLLGENVFQTKYILSVLLVSLGILVISYHPKRKSSSAA